MCEAKLIGYPSQNNADSCSLAIAHVILQNPAIEACEVVFLPSSDSFIPLAHLSLKPDFSGNAYQLLKELHEHCTRMLPPPFVPGAYKIKP